MAWRIKAVSWGDLIVRDAFRASIRESVSISRLGEWGVRAAGI